MYLFKQFVSITNSRNKLKVYIVLEAYILNLKSTQLFAYKQKSLNLSFNTCISFNLKSVVALKLRFIGPDTFKLKI